MEPKVLLFDEPLSNLDAKLREQMRAEIRRIQQTLGITSVYVTHDQAEAMALSDRIVVMHHGRVVQVGTAYDVYRRPVNAFVADFIGKANLLPARVVEVSSDRLDLEVLRHHSASRQQTVCTASVRQLCCWYVRKPSCCWSAVARATQVAYAARPILALWWSTMLTWLTWRSA